MCIEVIRAKHILPQAAPFFRRFAIDAVGYKSTIELNHATEYYLWVKIACSYSMMYTLDRWAYYRIGRQSMKAGNTISSSHRRKAIKKLLANSEFTKCISPVWRCAFFSKVY